MNKHEHDHDHHKTDAEPFDGSSCEEGAECCGGKGGECCKGEGHECDCAHEGHDHEGHEHGMPHTTVKVRKPNTSGVADEGTLVSVHYTGTLDDGETFDTSQGREPIEFVIGEHAVIRGFEEGVTGMKKGDKKKIVIEPQEGYGDVNPQLRQEVPKAALGDIEPEVGMMLALQHPMAPQPIPVKVVEVGAESITIDLNHPLAGKRLHFELELVELK